jgi:RHS repeat-associated protein
MKTVDASGTAVNSYTYDVYGTASASETVPNEFDFGGQQTDQTTGLQYLRARYYDPTAGRFISRTRSLMVHPGLTDTSRTQPATRCCTRIHLGCAKSS